MKGVPANRFMHKKRVLRWVNVEKKISFLIPAGGGFVAFRHITPSNNLQPFNQFHGNLFHFIHDHIGSR